DRVRPAGHRPVAAPPVSAEHVVTGPDGHSGTRRIRPRVRARARRLVRRRGRPADGVLAPQAGASARAGVDLLRRRGHAGNLRAAWHFIHPRSYHPERLERVAGHMFGGRLRTEPEIVRSMHIRRPTDARAALYRMAGLF